MSAVAVALLTMLASATDSGTVKAGDHLFVRAKIVNCGDAAHVIDHVQVAESGEAAFANGFKLNAVGLTSAEIAARLARYVGVVTGRTPKTLAVDAVPETDAESVARNLMTLLHEPSCAANPRRIPADPPPAQDHDRIIALDARAAPRLTTSGKNAR